jgi:hypothetical protein
MQKKTEAHTGSQASIVREYQIPYSSAFKFILSLETLQEASGPSASGWGCIIGPSCPAVSSIID